MPDRRIALLRGINVGRAKRVAMADLRRIVEGLGYDDVKTLLNSGNVVFTVPATVRGDVAARIEKAVAAELGVNARVTVITAKELAQAIADNPLIEVANDPSRLLVAVLNDPADRKRLAAMAESDWSPEGFAVGKRVAYLWCAEGIIASRLAKVFEKTLGDAATSRNWATMQKLMGLAS